MTKDAGLFEKPHFYGHRDRLRERFASDFGDGMPDYELMELLLFQIIPRRDVKPLAKVLITRFGSFAEVIAAPIEQLSAQEGLGETSALALKTIYAAAKRLTQQHVMQKPVLNSQSALWDYCRVAMAYEGKE